MKKFGRRVLPLLLALCMLPGLAACGREQEDTDEELSATVYVPEFLDMDFIGENGYFYGGCTDGQFAYMLVARYPEDGEGDTAYQLLRMSLEGGTPQPLENFRQDGKPEGYDYAYCGINNISAGAGGTLWIEEYIGAYAFDLPEDFDPEKGNYWEYDVTDSMSSTYRVQLDSTGNEITRFSTDELREKIEGDSFYAGGELIDGDGDLFVCTDDKVIVLDSSLNIRFEVEGSNLWGNLTLLSDGAVGTVVTESDTVNNTYTRLLRTIDKSAGDWGAEYELPTGVYEAYNGSGEYLFYYMKGQNLYGYKAVTEEGEDPNTFLVNLLEADISADNLEFFSFLADGRIVVMARSYVSEGRGLTLAILTPTPRSEIPEKTVLTYATMYLGQTERNRIVDFNRSSAQYRIQVRDYSEYRTEDDYMAGVQKLNTEILAGEVPDIISVSNLPIRQYGAKGILEDLWPYIDSDPDIGGRAGLMDRVFTAAGQEGKLYQIFETFSIGTVVGAKSVVGDRTSWTLADMQAALDSMPEGCALFNDYDTKGNVLSTVLSMNLDSFVDWNEGKCYFDTDQFKNLLAFADSFPLEYDWEAAGSSGEWDDDYTRISEGRQMLMNESISQFQAIQMQKAEFGGEISYIGFPVEDGGVGSCFEVDDGWAMSAACADKEGAWSFMRQLLLPKYTGDDDGFFNYREFPANKADFDAVVKASMTPSGYEVDENGEQVLDEDGNPIETSNWSWGVGGGLTISIYATTQEEYDQIMDLYNKVDRMAGADTNVYNIVNEVAGSYFAGDRSLDDAAGLIQNKVTTYVNENR